MWLCSRLKYELFCVCFLLFTHTGAINSRSYLAMGAFQDRPVYYQHAGQTCLLSFLTNTDRKHRIEGGRKRGNHGTGKERKEAKISPLIRPKCDWKSMRFYPWWHANKNLSLWMTYCWFLRFQGLILFCLILFFWASADKGLDPQTSFSGLGATLIKRECNWAFFRKFGILSTKKIQLFYFFVAAIITNRTKSRKVSLSSLSTTTLQKRNEERIK